MTKQVSIPDKYSAEDVARALQALERAKEQSKKWREKAKSPEYKAKAAVATSRRRAEQQLLMQKAKAAGITVTKSEVDAWLAKGPVAVKK